MKHEPVSNARRVGFTALAVVVFWVLALRAYSITYGIHSDSNFCMDMLKLGWLEFREAAEAIGDYRITMGFILGIAPAILLTFSASGSPTRLFRAWRLLVSGVLLMGCLGLSVGIAVVDAYSVELSTPHPSYPILRSWFLLPLLLTTAFVIFASWRQAVRDAAVVEEDDDPCPLCAS